MGLEVGWHLRLSKACELRFYLKPDLADLAKEQHAMSGGWDMELINHDGMLEAVFTRRVTRAASS